MKLLTLVGTVALMVSALPAAGQQPDLRARPNDSWIAISGTVTSAGPESFVLDYGKGTVTVEMDDWDWYSEGYKVLTNDKVRVQGFVDDDLFETRTIEASNVYVENLGTYFYASSADEEDPYIPYGINVDPLTTVVTGTVTGVQGRTFTIDTGVRQLTVDTSGMAYNPVDKQGYQQVDKGDRVSVTGQLEDPVFSKRELEATSVLTLSEDPKTKRLTSGSRQTGQQASQRGEEQDAQPTGTAGTIAATATVEKIVDRPENWYGKKVTIRGEVGDIFSTRLFNVEEQGIVDVDDELLVIVPEGKTYPTFDRMVNVTGDVRRFVEVDLQREYGLDWDLVPEILVQFRDRPVLVASSVELGPSKD